MRPSLHDYDGLWIYIGSFINKIVITTNGIPLVGRAARTLPSNIVMDKDMAVNLYRTMEYFTNAHVSCSSTKD